MISTRLRHLQSYMSQVVKLCGRDLILLQLDTSTVLRDDKLATRNEVMLNIAVNDPAFLRPAAACSLPHAVHHRRLGLVCVNVKVVSEVAVGESEGVGKVDSFKSCGSKRGNAESMACFRDHLVNMDHAYSWARFIICSARAGTNDVNLVAYTVAMFSIPSAISCPLPCVSAFSLHQPQRLTCWPSQASKCTTSKFCQPPLLHDASPARASAHDVGNPSLLPLPLFCLQDGVGTGCSMSQYLAISFDTHTVSCNDTHGVCWFHDCI
jgi:hypothetical protein